MPVYQVYVDLYGHNNSIYLDPSDKKVLDQSEQPKPLRALKDLSGMTHARDYPRVGVLVHSRSTIHICTTEIVHLSRTWTIWTPTPMMIF